MIFFILSGNSKQIMNVYECNGTNTGCPRMFYTHKCKILRFFITIKTIEFGILIYLSDRAILLAFWRILNQGNRQNKTEIHDIM